MLRGLTTVTFYVDDLRGAVAWYTEMLGVEPYFLRPSAEEPAYVEFRIGDHEDELGLIDSSYLPESRESAGPGRATPYWHVDDVGAAQARLLELGATELEPVIVREAGFVTAAVLDPFGNVLGLMHSPHWLEQVR
ncbi:VOC family protein [Georgenia halophila]|uniref:VOC family protein n=1 Tax=Georgenia halophila TaxID=620889 RepID=A0ABP8LM32_9MICO